MSIAICFPLSWKLLIYALETLFVASDKTPVHLFNRQVHIQSSMDLPARVRFPLRVKLVLRAPVPAYILDKASPFSAHNSRWYDHSECEFTHSLRTRRRYCSRLDRDRISCTKFVRSRLFQTLVFLGSENKSRTSPDNSFGRPPFGA